MTDYVIGDIQGCYNGLKGVLNKVKFDPAKDRLFAVGDLVARGEDSLSVLEYCYDLGDAFQSVLGNHDLHFLAIAYGLKKAKDSDRLDSLLSSKRLPQLVQWLRNFPLALQYNPDTLICHAGLFPAWSIQDATHYSNLISHELTGDNLPQFLATMYGNFPDDWHADLSGVQLHRFIINACTRMRYLTHHGQLNFSCKSNPSAAPVALAPWFNLYNAKLLPHQRVIFGHWAALQGKTDSSQFIGLDTGYVWGGAMTLYNLTDYTFVAYNA